MNVIFVVVTTLLVQTVQVFLMVVTLKMNAVLVTVTLQMTVYRIVLVPGVAA